MLKTGFRGERKKTPPPPPPPRGGGECGDGKSKETSHLTHTPLSRCTYPVVAGYLGEGEGSNGKGSK